MKCLAKLISFTQSLELITNTKYHHQVYSCYWSLENSSLNMGFWQGNNHCSSKVSYKEINLACSLCEYIWTHQDNVGVKEQKTTSVNQRKKAKKFSARLWNAKVLTAGIIVKFLSTSKTRSSERLMDTTIALSFWRTPESGIQRSLVICALQFSWKNVLCTAE